MSGDDPSDRDGGGDDPFDEEPSDDVEDPFAALGEGVDEDAEPAGADGSAGDAEASPADPDPEPAAPADDPFADLDADAAGSPADEDPFESMGTGDVGDEDVWEALDEGTSVGADATEFDPEAGDELDSAAGWSADPSTGGPATGDEQVVDKRSYCQRCPHFTAPPETACSHEGTAIVESVDFSRFRVRNCPMVEAEDPAFDGE
ncbi:hypothetical protein C463_05075 [Halorubrum californiense DSM 19288]|uniref:DUF8135 domain-containing protein n=1 Tax=Halorubrum californiense DSM 19288 TaxID=1227465 RepID=M0EDA1_9EURY|nr:MULTISPECIES: hypothetical protein [Halorubrum]ELZ45781.1 hypothetical protein C463_05075 [Halorubrum californiense DSM 19288]TKX67807.1 hypothetical protein EXE40_14340 [Halorubrum sp. GN11GM_10-3_MGM]